MKNMSFGKMVGIFFAFLVLMVVVAVLVIKMNQKSADNTPQVITKVHSKRDQLKETNRVIEQGVEQPILNAETIAAGAATTANQAPIQAPVVASVPAYIDQRLTNADNNLANLDARVTVLEGFHKAPTKTVHASPRKRSSGIVAASTPVPSTQTKPITELAGYKAMAIVNHRAWVATPNGSEDSATKTDATPTIGIRSMSVDSGVVITTSDNRIEPH